MKAKTLYLFALALLLGACHKEKKDDTAAQIMPVEVAKPVVVDSVVIHKSFPGVVKAADMVNVVPMTSGRITRKCFKDGDYVQRGQVLYQIDGKAYQAAVAEARAAINSAQSQYNFYKHQAESMRKALAEDAVSRINVEQAESNMKQAEASIAEARARLQDAQTQLGYCTVTAPISGQTGEGVDAGTYAAAGQTAMCTIVDNRNLKVVFSIDEAQYHQIDTEGFSSSSTPLFRNVPVTFGEGLDGVWYTDLYYASPSVDTSTGSITLEGRITKPDSRIRDGMFVSVSLPMSTTHNAVLVRDASIGTDQLGQYLYLVNDSNKVVYTPIKTGETYQDTLRVVTEGVTPQSKYVTTALLTVRNGMKVKPLLAP